MAEANPQLPLEQAVDETVTPPEAEASRRRTRPKPRKLRKDRRKKIVQRVVRFYTQDEENRSEDREARLQRYAKIRGWNEVDDGLPWPNSSNIALPDISQAVEQTQDTLVNAALATRPTVMAKALHKNAAEKERRLSNMLDVQFYEEQTGEVNMHELAQTFTEDGTFVAFVPWVNEKRAVVDRSTFPPIPDDQSTLLYLRSLVMTRFGPKQWRHFNRDRDGWSWTVRSLDGKEERKVEFYTKNELPDDVFEVEEDIEMEVTYTGTIFDGPKVMVKDYEDVLAPARASNLQIPGPSNPNGATHVILRDYPTFEEVQRLKESGYYDLLTAADLERMQGYSGAVDDSTSTEEKRQKDDMQGVDEHSAPEDHLHGVFTRLTCFDIYDFEDGNGPADMIWTVLVEPEVLCKAVSLTEAYPVPDGERPMRPLAEAQYLPVKGRRLGRSLPELMEGLHDYNKALFDQLKDLGDIAMTPFFFYRPGSSMNPEIASIAPGEGYPMEDPRDVFFPQINVQGGAFGLNLLTVASQMQDKLTVMGDLQQGRVPAGRSAALRTTGNLQALLAQGEARPERVLRRFFMGVTTIYRLMHRLNQFYLPKQKQFRIAGIPMPNEDPYQQVTREEIASQRFDFTFMPNIQNASLQAKQQSLQQMGIAIMNPLTIQMGIVRPDDVYRYTRDLAMTFGQDADQYMTAPSPESKRKKITAESAMSAILFNEVPGGVPIESAQAHMDKLQDLLETPFKDPETGRVQTLQQRLSNQQAAILADYLRSVSERIQEEERMRQRALAAAQVQQQAQARSGGREQTTLPPSTAPPPVQAGELIDETLPGAGGGAVQ